jgi:uncharacterized membrane protein HdeD (DUF308 family)
VSGRQLHRLLTLGLSALLIVVGIAAVIRTAVAGGSATALGYVLGIGLVVAGILRLYVLRRT